MYGEVGTRGIEDILDFRVYTLLTVCECMNYIKAVEVPHITQPAASQYIRYLETFYSVRPFTSEGKKIYLTPIDKRLPQAFTTLKNDEELLKEALHRVPEQGPTLRSGTTRIIGRSAVSASLVGYIHRHPEANIKVAIGNTDELPYKLTSGEIQSALVEGYYGQQAYDSLVYCTEPFIPVCAVCHQFKKDPGQLKDLLGEHLLICEPGSGIRDILGKNPEIKNIRLGDLAHMTEVGSMRVILQLLEKDSGTTFLHRTTVEQGVQDGAIRELWLEDFQMEHDFAFIRNEGSIYGGEYREIYRELQ